jgi:hypothetical protein
MEPDNDRNLAAMPTRKPVPKQASPVSPSLSATTWGTIPIAFAVGTVLSTTAFAWPLRWLLSGAPFLFFIVLLGESRGHRILPRIPLWSIFASLNLIYALAATSWLFYWLFAALCYPAILLSCLFQFDYAAGLARRQLRKLLRDLHFTTDKIAFFDLPALEIDTTVNGLMVIRGITFSFSTLTAVIHGVEVGVKLEEDMELAIQVEKVTISLLRKIEVDDVYANIKGGDWEMTFGRLNPDEAHSNEDAFMVTDTPILRTATAALNGHMPAPVKEKMKSEMTNGSTPDSSSDIMGTFESVKQVSPIEDEAGQKYREMIKQISDTSPIHLAKVALRERASDDESDSNLDYDNINDLRAAICAHLHDQSSIQHPPKRSIRVSTLAKNNHPALKKFLHRLPLLYRLLLSPICYFHPVAFKSITAAGSGKWFVQLMQQYMFKHYSTQDQDVRRLEERISLWLADANFAVQLGAIKATAQYPVNTTYDIDCHFKIADVMAYRTVLDTVNLTQVVRIGGADATLSLPIYLFPHHEHIMPGKPTEKDEEDMEKMIRDNEGAPQEIQAKSALEQLRKDEANMVISAHAHLPARFHQDLLNFIAAIVKASKVIETDQTFEEMKSIREMKRVSTGGLAVPDSDAASIKSVDSAISTMSEDTLTGTNPERKTLKSFLKKVDTGFKDAGVKTMEGMRRAGLSTASAMANDRWIAKWVGKILMKLEKAQGDVGYSGNVPISLAKYREKAEFETKILP